MLGWASMLKEWPEVYQSYNVAPTSKITVFRSNAGEVMRWGMIPAWAREFDSKYATFNARIETVAEKPTFRNAWNNGQRCLIPLAGYYEWKGEKGDKQPFYITDRNEGGLVVAGLWESWGQNQQLSCTILTKPADQELSNIHQRVPVMLTPDLAQAWLSEGLDASVVERPEVIYYPVDKQVGNSSNDGIELIQATDVSPLDKPKED